MAWHVSAVAPPFEINAVNMAEKIKKYCYLQFFKKRRLQFRLKFIELNRLKNLESIYVSISHFLRLVNFVLAGIACYLGDPQF